MERIKKIFFGIGIWPSIAVFWGLMLGADLDLIKASLFAALYSISYTLLAMGAERVTKLDYGVVLFWAFGLGLGLTVPSLRIYYLITHFSTFLYLSLFLMAFLPMVFGAEPFTMVFARRRTPEAFWETELFITINRIMTLIWAGLFLVTLLITLIPGFWTQILIPLTLVTVVGIPFNIKFPDMYLKSKGMGGMEALKTSTPPSINPSPAMPDEVATGNTPESHAEERRRAAEELGPVKNVLVVFGSPRGERGFTYKTLDRFLDGIREGGVEPEILFLNKYKIRPCTGCFTCWTKTPGVCIHKDDMPDLLEKVNKTDLVIYAQPLYVFSVPGITKNFMDRQVPLLQPFLLEHPDGSTYHPRRWKTDSGRRMLIFSVCGFPEMEHFDALIKMFRLMSRTSQRPIIGEILRPASESLRFGKRIGQSCERVMDALSEAGREVVGQGYVSRATEQAISQPIFQDVRAFRQIGNQFWNTWINYEEKKRGGQVLPDLEEYLARDVTMLLGGMASLYNPANAGDFEGVYQFDITGKENGKHYIQIKDHQCTFNEGEAESPGVVIHTPLDVWLAISNGELSGQEALMKGMYQVEGDLGLMLKIEKIFSG